MSIHDSNKKKNPIPLLLTVLLTTVISTSCSRPASEPESTETTTEAAIETTVAETVFDLNAEENALKKQMSQANTSYIRSTSAVYQIIDGAEVLSTEYSYDTDANGHRSIRQFTQYDTNSDGQYTYIRGIEQLNKGNIFREHMSAQGSASDRSTITYTYEDDGFTRKERLAADNTVITDTYNTDNQCISRNLTSTDGSWITIEYSYDSLGIMSAITYTRSSDIEPHEIRLIYTYEGDGVYSVSATEELPSDIAQSFVLLDESTPTDLPYSPITRIQVDNNGCLTDIYTEDAHFTYTYANVASYETPIVTTFGDIPYASVFERKYDRENESGTTLVMFFKRYLDTNNETIAMELQFWDGCSIAMYYREDIEYFTDYTGNFVVVDYPGSWDLKQYEDIGYGYHTGMFVWDWEYDSDTSNESDTETDSSNYDPYIDLYADTLQDLYHAVEEGNVLDHGYNGLNSVMVYEGLGFDPFGYAFRDINADGIPELLVLNIHMDSVNILECFTIRNGEVYHSFRGGVKTMIYLGNDDSILQYINHETYAADGTPYMCYLSKSGDLEFYTNRSESDFISLSQSELTIYRLEDLN